MLRICVVCATFLTASIAIAGPAEGDLFGYRLGTKYPLVSDTKGYYSFMGQAVLLADKPDKPANFKRVELIATPKTKTILNIYGIAELTTEKEAKEMAAQYADLLRTLHGEKCKAVKAWLDEALKLLCGGLHELTVAHYKPDKNEKYYKVHVGLTYSKDTEISKKLDVQFMTELNQLENEGKKQRLERANKEQKLRGLQ